MKKVLSFTLSMIMLLSVFTGLSFEAVASTGGHTQAEAVAWALNQEGVGFDGQYGYQCVNLVREYYAYLGQTRPTGNANTYLQDSNYHKPAGWTIHTGTAGMQPGDIMVYNGGTWGHVAIVVAMHDTYCDVMQQNADNKGEYRTEASKTHKGTRKYSEITGYIHPDFSASGDICGADLGKQFYAVILNTAAWKPISLNTSTNKVTLESEKNVAYQKWRFTRQDDGAYLIESCANGKVLEMTNGTRQICTQITAHYTWWGGAYQQWYLIPYGEGYIFQSKHFTSQGWVMDLYAANHDNGTVIQINNRNNSTAQVWSVYKGNDVQLRAPTLTVTAGTCGSNTVFKWNSIYGSQRYDVKIWKNKVDHSVSSYHTEWAAKSGYSVQLPPGTYEAYVTASDFYQIFGSDDVKFTVTDHNWKSPTYTWSSDNKTCTATRVCSRDSSHKETQTVNTTSQILRQPTMTQTGTAKYTAVFSNSAFSTQTKSVSLPKTYDGFPDVKEGSWYYDAVKYCAQSGFMSGYQNGNFGPNDSLKRQDFVVILANIAKADLSKYQNTDSKLKDVKKGAYYAAAVNWAVDKNIIAGYDNGNFGVNDNITREQIAVILYRYKNEPAVGNITSTLSKFSDYKNTSAFAVPAMAWAVQQGAISGNDDGTLAPTKTASRAQIASIIMRMDQKGMFK